eukprot:scaffold389013_cov27-Prasinocladus_malaysianus.AAC.1
MEINFSEVDLHCTCLCPHFSNIGTIMNYAHVASISSFYKIDSAISCILILISKAISGATGMDYEIG